MVVASISLYISLYISSSCVFETSLDSALSDSLYTTSVAHWTNMVYMLVSPTHIFFFALKRYFELIFGYLVEQILNSEFSFSLTILTLFARIS
jgi:hypothetical protein